MGRLTGLALLGIVIAIFLAGCDDKSGFEQAGEEIDEAIEDTRNGGETLGNKIDDAIDDVREGAEDAKRELQGN
ncbi:MAG: hypothetical protein NXI30_11390 [bacterium]|nr:hypothetical protein [bacterium]